MVFITWWGDAASMTVTVGAGPGRRVFISYAGRDRAWAEWVTWQLRAAGYATEYDGWDWPAGDNAVLRMSDALDRADQVVALLSEAYFERERFTTDEWTAVMAMHGRLVPLKIEPVTPPAMLGPIIFRELHGLAADQARQVLLQAVAGGRAGPGGPPGFPGEQATLAGEAGSLRLPGVLPDIWNVPARTGVFTGRDAVLLQLRDRLGAGGPVVVHALHGMGGVGKTTLAAEYAYRFANSYQLVWWVDAEQAGLIAEQLAQLAVTARWVPADTDTPTAVAETQRRLRTGTGWLVVFDNAVRPADLQPWLPQGSGHVLVTSRNPAWTHVGEPVEVDVFARDEAKALLRRLTPTITDTDADQLAAALGDLPLAVAQAGGVLAETGMPAAAYLHELGVHSAAVLADGTPPGYRVPLAAAIRVSMDKLASEDEAAVQLLRLCAFLAPEPIPADLFTTAHPAGVLPEPLATVAASRWALHGILGRIGRYGLATIDGRGLQLHRLTQAILQDQMTSGQHTDQNRRAEQLVAAACPEEADHPVNWPRWTQLLPHVLALNPTTSSNPDLRWTAVWAAWYLQARGDAQASRELANLLYLQWRSGIGPDQDQTLAAAHTLAGALQVLGEYGQARTLDEDTLTRRRRLYGYDHHDSLHSADSLAIDLCALGEHEQARQLHQDTVNRYRRTLGDDDTHTVSAANNLAVDLRALGQYELARQLHQDTLKRRRRILGDDHPDTLASANNLAADLSALGEHEQARQLHQDTLDRYQRVLGDNHPDTLKSANNLASTLRTLGKATEAEHVERRFPMIVKTGRCSSMRWRS
jgi:hypothetical protein